MYFNQKDDTNIDAEFQKDNLLSRFLNFLFKYKIIIIIFLVVIILLITMIIVFTTKKTPQYLELKGDDIVTIYQGDDYIEPGYVAYNSRNENLIDEVVIDSNLNNNVIGKYEVIYSLGDITKTRIINIIQKPKEYTFIHLNTVNNSKNIYLKINEQYKEPGYQALSSTGVDLTDKVKVTGKIDVSKKGIYELIYSVNDSNNVTISASRKVIVMDSDISLTLDTSVYTNKAVTINALVFDEYFEYMILPNGKKVTTNTYSYSVSNNGKYTFTTYNTKGISQTSSIEVKNIDKKAPTGSCRGSYQNGVSTIKISSSDNIGISKYVLHNKSYTSNNIVINSELTEANITIYDRAGNTKQISCKLEDKNTYQIEEPTNQLDDIYTSSNSHTSSINGIRYLLHNQSDSRWGDIEYPSGKTIAGIGCMITATAVVSSAYDDSITPKTVFDEARHDYPYKGINNLAGDGFSCKQISATNSKNNILNALSQGKVVVIMVYGKKKGGTSVFTTSQHFMALIDYKDDKIFVGNSYSSAGTGLSGWYDKDLVLTSVKEVNICTPKQTLIDKFNT